MQSSRLEMFWAQWVRRRGVLGEGAGPDNEDTFGRQDWDHLLDWNWRMRERQLSLTALGYSCRNEGSQTLRWLSNPHIPATFLSYKPVVCWLTDSPLLPWRALTYNRLPTPSLKSPDLQHLLISVLQVLSPWLTLSYQPACGNPEYLILELVGARSSTPNHPQVIARSSLGSDSPGGSFEACESSFPSLTPLYLFLYIFPQPPEVAAMKENTPSHCRLLSGSCSIGLTTIV